MSKTYAAFVCETDELLDAFTCKKPDDKAVSMKWPAVALNVAEGSVIRLYDSWNRFCREIVIQSAAELPLTATGTIVARARGVNKRSDVIAVLLSKLKPRPRFGEPRWANANECLSAAQALGITNYATVSAAIGATPSPTDHIRITRNFIAHRNQKTATEPRAVAVTYGIPGTQVEPYVRHVVTPGLTVFEKWISELRVLGEAAVQ